VIVKTTGIVLRLDPFSKTSQIISWLTPDQGRVATVAKGAKRPKNNLVGQYDCFYTCELLYYQTHRSSLHILKECSPLSPRMGFRSSWRASMGASYICSLLNRLTSPGASQPALYDWANRTLDFLSEQGNSRLVMNWAELKLLKLLGVGPTLSACLACGTRAFPGDRPVAFSISRGGLLCAACRNPADTLVIPVTHDALAMLRGWADTDTPIIAKRTACTPHQSNTANKLLGAFMHYHLESSLARDIAMGLI
jgi:DNA repair protein RecO (recombination protein O)